MEEEYPAPALRLLRGYLEVILGAYLRGGYLAIYLGTPCTNATF